MRRLLHQNHEWRVEVTLQEFDLNIYFCGLNSKIVTETVAHAISIVK